MLARVSGVRTVAAAARLPGPEQATHRGKCLFDVTGVAADLGGGVRGGHAVGIVGG